MPVFKMSFTARPIYKVLLAVAAVIYVIGVCMIQADLCYKVGVMQHKLIHISGDYVCEGHHTDDHK